MKLGDVVRMINFNRFARIVVMREVCVNKHKGEYDTLYYVEIRDPGMRMMGPFAGDEFELASAVDALVWGTATREENE